jgi:hypothetical protein
MEVQLMIFDYCEMDNSALKSSELLTIIAGCRFKDEPDELYVVQMDLRKDGKAGDLKLFFNGHDCNYKFKPEEFEAIQKYVADEMRASDYADWLEGAVKL